MKPAAAQVANEALRELRVRTDGDWQKTLARVKKNLTPAISAKQEGVLPKSCFESIGRVESALRGVIRTQFQARFGENWLKEVERTMDIEAYKAAIHTMRQWRQPQSTEFLHYTNLKDLDSLIVRTWDLFRQAFDGQKKDFNRLMATILKGRTEEAHHRPEHLWPEIEKQRVRVACHDLITRFKIT